MKILPQDVVTENVVVSSILRRGRRHLSFARAPAVHTAGSCHSPLADPVLPTARLNFLPFAYRRKVDYSTTFPLKESPERFF
jgi:hypothetical protein